MTTTNEKKAETLLRDLREAELDTLAGQLEEIIAQAWDEGAREQEEVVNPYRK
jgi:hypothetical protein